MRTSGRAASARGGAVLPALAETGAARTSLHGSGLLRFVTTGVVRAHRTRQLECIVKKCPRKTFSRVNECGSLKSAAEARETTMPSPLQRNYRVRDNVIWIREPQPSKPEPARELTRGQRQWIRTRERMAADPSYRENQLAAGRERTPGEFPVSCCCCPTPLRVDNQSE